MWYDGISKKKKTLVVLCTYVQCIIFADLINACLRKNNVLFLCTDSRTKKKFS